MVQITHFNSFFFIEYLVRFVVYRHNVKRNNKKKKSVNLTFHQSWLWMSFIKYNNKIQKKILQVESNSGGGGVEAFGYCRSHIRITCNKKMTNFCHKKTSIVEMSPNHVFIFSRYYDICRVSGPIFADWRAPPQPKARLTSLVEQHNT